MRLLSSQGGLYNENAGVSPARPHGAMACHPSCGQQTVTRLGITFELDDEGRLILTKEIMDEVMRHTFRYFLHPYSRFSLPETVSIVMRELDTPFYIMSQEWDDTFVLGGYLEFTAEEVNYVGVGMGMRHFHLLRLVPTSALVHGWNIRKYGHRASGGRCAQSPARPRWTSRSLRSPARASRRTRERVWS